MDRLGLEGAQAFANLFLGAKGQADLGIGRAGDGLEQAGFDDLDLMAHAATFRDGARQGADDAIDLRFPGVGGQNDAH